MRSVEEQLSRAAFDLIKEELQKKIGAIRDPETGEFARVRIFGSSLKDMRLEVDGSEQLLVIVKKELGLSADGTNSADGNSIKAADKLSSVLATSRTEGDFSIKDGGVYAGWIEPPRHERFSVHATAIARAFVEKSEDGMFGNPQYSSDDLMELTELTNDDVKDALHEIRHFVRDTGVGVFIAEATLFAEFDHLFMPWNPAEDAVTLADAMMSDESFPASPGEAASVLGWTPRRMSPAIVFLEERGAIKKWGSILDSSFVSFRLTKGDETRRFLNSVRL